MLHNSLQNKFKLFTITTASELNTSSKQPVVRSLYYNAASNFCTILCKSKFKLSSITTASELNTSSQQPVVRSLYNNAASNFKFKKSCTILCKINFKKYATILCKSRFKVLHSSLQKLKNITSNHTSKRHKSYNIIICMQNQQNVN